MGILDGHPRPRTVRYFISAAALTVITPFFLYALATFWGFSFPFSSGDSAIRALARNSEGYQIFLDRFGSVQAEVYVKFVSNFVYLNISSIVIFSGFSGFLLAMLRLDKGKGEFSRALTVYSLIFLSIFCFLGYYSILVPISHGWKENFENWRALKVIYVRELTLGGLMALSGLIAFTGLICEMVLAIKNDNKPGAANG